MSEEDDWSEMLNEPDVCDCEDYDVDMLIGLARCSCCGRTWLLTTEELRQEERFIASAAEAWEEEIKK